jgi:hypothetical protein
MYHSRNKVLGNKSDVRDLSISQRLLKDKVLWDVTLYRQANTSQSFREF